LTIGGVGLLGLAAGGAIGLVAKGGYDDADCASGVCPTPEAQSDAEDARQLANMGTIAAAAGGALLVVGATVFFLAPSDRSNAAADSAALRVTPGVGRDSGGVWVSGGF
jgi:hypothetical protein